MAAKSCFIGGMIFHNNSRFIKEQTITCKCRPASPLTDIPGLTVTPRGCRAHASAGVHPWGCEGFCTGLLDLSGLPHTGEGSCPHPGRWRPLQGTHRALVPFWRKPPTSSRWAPPLEVPSPIRPLTAASAGLAWGPPGVDSLVPTFPPTPKDLARLCSIGCDGCTRKTKEAN